MLLFIYKPFVGHKENLYKKDMSCDEKIELKIERRKAFNSVNGKVRMK